MSICSPPFFFFLFQCAAAVFYVGIILAVVLIFLGDMGGEALSWGSCRVRVFAGLSCELDAKEPGLFSKRLF